MILADNILLRQLGGYGQVVKAAGCGSAIRRFKSGYSPLFKCFSLKNFSIYKKLFIT